MIKILFIVSLTFSGTVGADEVSRVWIRVETKNKFERSTLANHGFHIDGLDGEAVVLLGKPSDIKKIQKLGLEAGVEIESSLTDFPIEDTKFHNYGETMDSLIKLADENPNLVKLDSIGKSLEGRELSVVQIATEFDDSIKKPSILFLGNHHAREHLSTEVPLMLAQYLVKEFKAGNKEIISLLNSRQIYIVPMVNPDGVEYDISGSGYQSWRKNRREYDGTKYGVDLNRNYSYKWGTGGSSDEPSDETFKGPTPFSEPESNAVKNFIDSHDNISILLTYHCFSQLILYPWGNTYDKISDSRDHDVFEKMALKMATWNKYKPMQTSDLYIASGDTTDWAYGVHKIFAFTFELDPKSLFSGGFYPGQKSIEPVFIKNLKPALYLISNADNPYKVLNDSSEYGINKALLNHSPSVFDDMSTLLPVSGQ